jgi:hypothetical protein
MSPYTNFLAPRSSLSGRIQIGHKSGLLLLFIIIYLFIYFIYSVNIKPTRHRFGFSLAWDWQYKSYEQWSTDTLVNDLVEKIRLLEDKLNEKESKCWDLNKMFLNSRIFNKVQTL